MATTRMHMSRTRPQREFRERRAVANTSFRAMRECASRPDTAETEACPRRREARRRSRRRGRGCRRVRDSPRMRGTAGRSGPMRACPALPRCVQRLADHRDLRRPVWSRRPGRGSGPWPPSESARLRRDVFLFCVPDSSPSLLKSRLVSASQSRYRRLELRQSPARGGRRGDCEQQRLILPRTLGSVRRAPSLRGGWLWMCPKSRTSISVSRSCKPLELRSQHF